MNRKSKAEAEAGLETQLEDTDLDRVLTEEDKRRMASIEQGLCEMYGPPEKREQMTRDYVDQMVAEYSEPFIRRLLHAMDEADDNPDYLRHLRGVDLDHKPLHEIIHPYGFFSYDLTIEKQGDGTLIARAGRAHGTCGGGNYLYLKRTSKHRFKVLSVSGFTC